MTEPAKRTDRRLIWPEDVGLVMNEIFRGIRHLEQAMFIVVVAVGAAIGGLAIYTVTHDQPCTCTDQQQPHEIEPEANRSDAPGPAGKLIGDHSELVVSKFFPVLVVRPLSTTAEKSAYGNCDRAWLIDSSNRNGPGEDRHQQAESSEQAVPLVDWDFSGEIQHPKSIPL